MPLVSGKSKYRHHEPATSKANGKTGTNNELWELPPISIREGNDEIKEPGSASRHKKVRIPKPETLL
jgi:hypothetical protein